MLGVCQGLQAGKVKVHRGDGLSIMLPLLVSRTGSAAAAVHYSAWRLSP